MQPSPPGLIRGLIRPVLALTLLFLTLPALAQYPGRADDSRRDRDDDRSEDRDENNDSRDDRRSWDRRRFDGNGDNDDDDNDRGSWDERRDDGRRGFGSPAGGYDRGRFGSSDNADSDRRDGYRPSPDDFFKRLDGNGNGRLDGDEMPDGRVGAYLERAGIQEGASREDFAQGFERARAARESERREEGDRSDSDGRRDQARSAGGFTPAPHERVTHELPESFLDRDMNQDGQIALHEWRDWNWAQVDEFFFLDRNGDGFLTPQEIITVFGPTSDSQASSGPAGPSRSTPAAPQSPDRLDENNEHVIAGRKYFDLLDRDQDGRASVAELGRLNKLRPLFERANIPLDRPMTANEFTANYHRAATAPYGP